LPRNHPRLKGHDYSSDGVYYITFCVKKRKELLGKIVEPLDGESFIELSEYGEVIFRELEETNSHYENLFIDKFVVMTNHVHLVVIIRNDDGGLRESGLVHPSTALIPGAIVVLKKKSNRVYGFSMWQDSYYDRIVRDEKDYIRICNYIEENPAKWAEDEYCRLGGE